MTIFLAIVFIVLTGMVMMWAQAMCDSKMHEHLPDPFWFPSAYGIKVAMCKEDQDDTRH